MDCIEPLLRPNAFIQTNLLTAVDVFNASFSGFKTYRSLLLRQRYLLICRSHEMAAAAMSNDLLTRRGRSPVSLTLFNITKQKKLPCLAPYTVPYGSSDFSRI